ncbi:sensor histidine kinase [Comamonas endophytica]|uniref:Histidine kinase n=1 Tax=Comamonas endophytica TaxID=2949090 RepID=A0ABY6GDS7_9BURK|nr:MULTISPECIES: histidine kinase [unclassified Acidovorax]MCD2513478.1 histidine kinase [Acidovorax sp. D4N7]UYG52507.1 histidine kinase [Acidovorax sp. 5MLIR]
MRDMQILSTPPASVASGPALAPTAGAAQRVLVFDACHVGVVLRAVLFVQLVVATAALFSAATPLEWLARMALFTSGTLPGTLLWLVVACGFKRLLQRLPRQAQYAAGMGLGALCGLHACAMLWLLGDGLRAPWLASAAGGMLLAALLVAALQLRARARAPAATTARLAELQSRIRPHFLFNTLNSAIALVRAEPAQAEALLEDLSDLFRAALAEPHASTTLDEEIALAQRYLAIEQVRFGARLRAHWQLDPQAGGARLPPLLLQPLVENAIRHGIEPSAEGGTLVLTTALRHGRAEITITNSLPPGPAPATRGHGIALRNVRERLSLLHDLQAEFSAGSHQGGWRVRILLPLEKSA